MAEPCRRGWISIGVRKRKKTDGSWLFHSSADLQGVSLSVAADRYEATRRRRWTSAAEDCLTVSDATHQSLRQQHFCALAARRVPQHLKRWDEEIFGTNCSVEEFFFDVDRAVTEGLCFGAPLVASPKPGDASCHKEIIPSLHPDTPRNARDYFEARELRNFSEATARTMSGVVCRTTCC